MSHISPSAIRSESSIPPVRDASQDATTVVDWYKVPSSSANARVTSSRLDERQAELGHVAEYHIRALEIGAFVSFRVSPFHGGAQRAKKVIASPRHTNSKTS